MNLDFISLKEPLHNSLRSVISRSRAVCCVVFLGKAQAIACKKTPCSPSRSDVHSLARVMQRALTVAENSLAFVDKRVHAFLLVIRRKQGVEDAPLKHDAVRKAALK